MFNLPEGLESNHCEEAPERMLSSSPDDGRYGPPETPGGKILSTLFLSLFFWRWTYFLGDLLSAEV